MKEKECSIIGIHMLQERDLETEQDLLSLQFFQLCCNVLYRSYFPVTSPLKLYVVENSFILLFNLCIFLVSVQ